jgi:hypothetical protein
MAQTRRDPAAALVLLQSPIARLSKRQRQPDMWGGISSLSQQFRDTCQHLRLQVWVGDGTRHHLGFLVLPGPGQRFRDSG